MSCNYTKITCIILAILWEAIIIFLSYNTCSKCAKYKNFCDNLTKEQEKDSELIYNRFGCYFFSMCAIAQIICGLVYVAYTCKRGCNYDTQSLLPYDTRDQELTEGIVNNDSTNNIEVSG